MTLRAVAPVSISGTALVGGTPNGVLYLDNSGFLSSGSALTFDGTNLGIGTSSPGSKLTVSGTGTTAITSVKNTDNFTGGTNFTEPHLSVNSGNTVTGNVTRLALTVGSGGQVYFDSLMEDGVTAYSSLLIRTRGAGGVHERARIDSSGNLGLGVTPSGWSGVKAIDISTYGALAANTAGYVELWNNAYYNGSVSIYKNTGAASFYQQFGGSHRWFTAPSGTAGAAISFTQAMTLDASGRLGIGLTNPSQALDVNGIALFEGAAQGNIIIQKTGTNGFSLFSSAAGTLGFYDQSAGAERARIDSSGNLLVGKTSATSNGGDVQVSKGITFPATQVACSDANTLDDYEEGTFTPVATTTGTPPTIPQTGIGFYTKIGRQVTVTCSRLDSVNMSGSTGALKITGLPFTSVNNTGNSAMGACVLYKIDTPTGAVNISAFINDGVSYVSFIATTDGAAYQSVTDNGATDGRIWFTITYFV